MGGGQIYLNFFSIGTDVSRDVEVVAFCSDVLHADALGVTLLFLAELIGVDDLRDVLGQELILSFTLRKVFRSASA